MSLIIPQRKGWKTRQHTPAAPNPKFFSKRGGFLYLAPYSYDLARKTTGSGTDISVGARRAASFNGSTSKVDFGTTGMDFAAGATLVAVFSPGAFNGRHIICARDANGNSIGVQIGDLSNACIGVSASAGGANLTGIRTATGGAALNTWYAVVGTISGVTAQALYIDGVQISTVAQGAFAAPTGNSIMLGTRLGSTGFATAEIAVAAILPYTAGHAEALSLSANPWQLFEPEAQPVLVSLGGGALTLTGENGSLTLTGQSATANTNLVGTNATATLTGQTATTNLSLVGTNGTLTLAGQNSTFTLTGALTLAGEAATLGLTGQSATTNLALVGTNATATLTGQSATANVSLVGTNGTLTVTGQNSTFTLGGPVTLVGTTASLSLTGQDSGFVLTGQTRGGKGKAKIKKRRRLPMTEDNEELLDVIQSLEEEKLALQKLQEKKKKEVVKEATKELVKVLEVEPVVVEKQEEPDAVSVLVLRVDTMSQTITQLEANIKALEKQLEINQNKMLKKVQQLEELVIVLNNQ